MKKQFLSLVLICSFQSSFAQFLSTNGPKMNAYVGYVWGSGDTAFVTNGENLYRTFNGGIKWTVMANGLPNQVDPRAITVAKDVVYVGTNDKARIYISSDWGNTWEPETDGSTVLWKPTHLTSNGQTVLIGGTLFPPHYFDDVQQKWISSGLGGTTHGLRYVDDSTVICNVGSPSTGKTHISKDGGKTWTQIGDEPSASNLNIKAKTYDYAKIGKRIICTPSMNGYQPQYSDDNGDTWTEGSGATMSNLPYYGRKLNIREDGTILLNKTGVLYQSKDSGVTWTTANSYLGVDFTFWQTEYLLCSGGNIDDKTHTRFGFITSANNLIDLDGVLYTEAQFYGCNYTKGNWSYDSIINHKNSGRFGTVNKVELVNDSIYFCTTSGIFGSKSGAEFVSQIQSEIGRINVGAFSKSGNQYVAGSISSRGNAEPEIYYSGDMKTWTKATFSNKIGFGAGGVANRFDNFFTHGGKLYADLQGGYAVSSDNGKNWAWKGGSVYGNVVSNGSVLVRLKDDIIGVQPRLLEMSTDNGDTWVKTLDGLPGYTGQSNFRDFGDVYYVDGEIYTEAFGEGTRRLVVLDVANKKWTATSENSTLPDVGIMTDLISVNKVLYAAIQNDGVYAMDDDLGFESIANQKIQLVPNPATTHFSFDATLNIQSIQIISINGSVIVSDSGLQGNQISTADLSKGTYIVLLQSDKTQYYSRLIKL
jgi:photosystem II stability/assembly factor-like uncharacterized protein